MQILWHVHSHAHTHNVSVVEFFLDPWCGAGEMAWQLRVFVAFVKGPIFNSQYPHGSLQPLVTNSRASDTLF